MSFSQQPRRLSWDARSLGWSMRSPLVLMAGAAAGAAAAGASPRALCMPKRAATSGVSRSAPTTTGPAAPSRTMADCARAFSACHLVA